MLKFMSMYTCVCVAVRWDRYQCPLHDQVLELKKWMTELQDLLSYGCRMDGAYIVLHLDNKYYFHLLFNLQKERKRKKKSSV